MNHLHNQIINILTERLNLGVPGVDVDLIENGDLDSLSLIDLLLYIEKDLDVKTSYDELEIDNFRSVQKIAEFIVRNRGYSLEGIA
jgi:acyl carrier protein